MTVRIKAQSLKCLISWLKIFGILKQLLHEGRGGGQVVSVLAFYSDDPGSNPAESTVFKWANPGYFLFILVLFSLQFKYKFKKHRCSAWGSHPGPQNDEHSKMPESRYKSKWTGKMLMLKCQKLREHAALIQRGEEGLRGKFEIRQIWNCSNVISSNRQCLPSFTNYTNTHSCGDNLMMKFRVEFVLYSEIIPCVWTFKSCDNF